MKIHTSCHLYKGQKLDVMSRVCQPQYCFCKVGTLLIAAVVSDDSIRGTIQDNKHRKGIRDFYRYRL